MQIRLLLIRHAATEAGDDNCLVGASDVPADERGLKEVERLPGILNRFAPGAWYCSPLRRARQTAERLEEIDPVHREFIMDERLREIDFGRWEMKSFHAIAAAEPDAVRSWLQFGSFVFPGGEGVGSFQERLRAFLADLSRTGAREIGVITHGGVIRTMICLALGLSPANYLLFEVRPTSVTIIDLYEAGGVLAGLNI